jgi:hypothetical protein
MVGLLCATALLCVGACQKSEGPLEKAGEAIDETMDDVGDKMHEAGHDMEDMANGE